MNDRIKLANLLGKSHLETRFDPFTDANDDYAVLEWMRVLADTGMRDDLEAWEKYAMALCVVDDGHDLSLIFNYQIGDYARAALEGTRQRGVKT